MKITFPACAGLIALSALTFGSFPAFAAGGIDIQNGWVRATPNGARAGAAYLTISNEGAAEDRLIGGGVNVAPTVQIHEMKVTNGIMSMRQIEGGLVLQPHAKTELKPGGYHLMLIGLTKPIVAGDDIVLTLHFAKAGDMTVHLPAKDASTMQTMGGMAHKGGAQ